MNIFAYTYAKEQLLKKIREDMVITEIAYPLDEAILLKFHLFDEAKNFITFNLFIYDRLTKQPPFVALLSQWDFIVSIQPGARGSVVEIPTQNEEYGDFVDIMRNNMKPIVQKAFHNALNTLCDEPEREACEYCKNFNPATFAYVRDNLDKYWFNSQK